MVLLPLASSLRIAFFFFFFVIKTSNDYFFLPIYNVIACPLLSSLFYRFNHNELFYEKIWWVWNLLAELQLRSPISSSTSCSPPQAPSPPLVKSCPPPEFPDGSVG